ncbi:MAG: hypothetical protein M5U31_14180 [Acidimicrobiia bacterium]|nr:hypothetical protein [Acidimicrobiia bacterium]
MADDSADEAVDDVSDDATRSLPFHDPLRDAFPALHEAQNAYLARIDSLPAPDRRAHELVRLAYSVSARASAAVERHAQLAHEVGATWEDVMGTIMLSIPSLGLLPATEAIPAARRGFDAALDAEVE